MKPKPKTCPICGKKVRYLTIGWCQHQAMHERKRARDVIADRHERDQAQASCAEMRTVLEQFEWEDATPHGNFPSMAEWEHALSTDCGKGYFAASELAPTIKLLRQVNACCMEEDDWDQIDGDSVRSELTRLKALREEQLAQG